MRPSPPFRRARLAGLLLGLGLGGFVDGIALHQIVHWHNMLSARVPPVDMRAMKINMVADGWFHAGVWVLTLAGVLLLWSAARTEAPLPPVRWLLGLLMGGWGLFNLVEGVVNHLVLEVHHVRDDLGGPLAWDLAFLGLGALLVVGGWLLQRSAVRR